MKNKIKQFSPAIAVACHFISGVAHAQTVVSVHQGSVVKNNFKHFFLPVVMAIAAISGTVQAQSNVVQNQGLQVVQGAPVAPKEEKKLQYWDASKPLTVGDMSEIHRSKMAEDFLSQHGFTTQEKPKPVLSTSATKPKPLPKPPHSLQVRAIYGLKHNPSADVVIDGLQTTVRDGSSLKSDELSVNIKKDGEGKLMAYAEKLPTKKCHSAKKKSCNPVKLTASHLIAGESVEWKR